MNPILRYRKANRLTQEALAEQAGVSPLVVLRTEQGLYNKIPPSILRLIQPNPETNQTPAYDYRHWQRLQRQHAQDILPSYFPTSPTPTSPLLRWREVHDVSAVGACKALCVHQAVWANAETGRTKSLPLQLLEALQDAGYTTEFITELRLEHERFCNGVFSPRV